MTTVELTQKVIKDLVNLANSLEVLLKAVDSYNMTRAKSTENEGNAYSVKTDDVASAQGEVKEIGEIEEATVMKEKTGLKVADGTKEKEVLKDSDVVKETQPTLEEVRALLADKNRDGHREAIKAILTKYGANKLTSLDPVHYNKVMQEAGGIK